MLNVDLSTSEKAILRDVLETEVSDLGMEIAATERLAFRDQLKERRDVLQKVIAALANSPDTRST